MMEKVNQKLDSGFDRIYSNYEKWLIVPALLILLSAGIIGANYVNNGEFVSKGIDFTGGIEIKIETPNNYTKKDIETALTGELENINVRGLGEGGENRTFSITSTTQFRGESVGGDSIQAGNESQRDFTDVNKEVNQMLKRNNIQTLSDPNINTVGGTVSGSFLFEAQIAVLIAFLIMSTAIFVAFRSLVPSAAVIAAAFTDILVAIAGMNLLGINLTLGSLAALLMLIGYSVDTDIVLSTRVLKQRKGDLKDRIKNSIGTGMTMTGGAITAFTVLYLVSPSVTLDQIAAVILIGLVTDLPATWFGNAIILKMHSEGRI